MDEHKCEKVSRRGDKKENGLVVFFCPECGAEKITKECPGGHRPHMSGDCNAEKSCNDCVGWHNWAKEYYLSPEKRSNYKGPLPRR
jgi:hypothetical protein